MLCCIILFFPDGLSLLTLSNFDVDHGAFIPILDTFGFYIHCYELCNLSKFNSISAFVFHVQILSTCNLQAFSATMGHYILLIRKRVSQRWVLYVTLPKFIARYFKKLFLLSCAPHYVTFNLNKALVQ